MNKFNFAPNNLANCLRLFKLHSNSNLFSSVQSTIIKYCLVSLGFQLNLSKRLTNKQIESAYKFMESFPIKTCLELKDAFQSFCENNNVSSSNKAKYLYNLRTFIDWYKQAEKSWYQVDYFNGGNIYRFSGELKDKIQRKKLTNRGKMTKFKLSLDPSDYPHICNAETYVQLIKGELSEFENFMKRRGFSDDSIKTRCYSIIKIFGWLYLSEKVPLSELSFTSIIAVTSVNISSVDYDSYDEYINAKGFSIQEIREIAKKTIALLKEFFAWLPHSPSPNTKSVYVQSVLLLAKFLYREETNSSTHTDCEDIPVVLALQNFHNRIAEEIKQNPPVVAYENKAVTWSNAMYVLNRSRFEAILADGDKICKGKCRKRERELRAMSNSMNRFLLLALLTLIPPDRQQIARSLVWQEDLIYGRYCQGQLEMLSSFVSDTDTDIGFYLNIYQDKYKVGKFYGDWLGKIPNYFFPDGTQFYDYLELWLMGDNKNNPLRSILKLEDDYNQSLRLSLHKNAANHNYVFLGRNKGNPLNRQTLGSIIRHLFERMSNVPVSPNTLRHMFRTYVNELGISKTESESIAFWMKHSPETAAKYSRQTLESKLQPGFSLLSRINQNLLSKTTTNNPHCSD
ncbi:tyrosine-type recombinase/integrase [Cyanobacterium aponinum]|uniref:Tyrosine-type recombinase/integrase n=1 Tax=Cyanobacterium aponinum 0216 TaxID=2676140 RepID=A0A844GZA0_9CHRO|nr:tyrosine-type recombinase/integrase [Cyanobacterium aponinum]MTF40392.1 tyrosine-type recombinase/integrase [Cyanobacterium aponinum 0216]